METLGLGLALGTYDNVIDDHTPRWPEIRHQAQLAEAVGFDTVWIADEFQWESEAWDEPIGWWECVALTGAIAASTSTIDVGTWVLSALHRNAGLTARVVETLNEISGGRFIFGFGAGHAGRQGAAFGFPPNYTVSRYEEALEIIASARGDGATTFHGSYHDAEALAMIPRPDGRPAIPLLLGGHGPRTMRLAVDNADIWSAYATTSSQPAAFAEMLANLDRVCEEAGRDPATLGRSIGVAVAAPKQEPTGLLAADDPIRGSADDIAATFAQFADMGVTRLEILAAGDQVAVIEGLAPVIEAVQAP